MKLLDKTVNLRLTAHAIKPLVGIVVTLVISFVSVSAFANPAPQAPQSWDIAFYTFGFTGIVFYAVTMLAMREIQWLSYAVYGSLLLLLWSSLDGTLAFMVGGGQRFMSIAPLVVGSITTTFGFAHAAYRLEAPHALIALRAPFIGFATIGAALLPGLAVIDSFVPLYATLNTLMLLVVAAQVFPAITWYSLTTSQRRVAIAWPALLAISGIGFYALHFLGEGFSRGQLDLGNRIIFIMHIAHTLSFAVVYVLDQVKERQLALQQAAEEARRAAETALELERSKQDYQRAQNLAHTTSRQLAEASHDIKQPITALRMAVGALEHDNPQQDAGRILQAVDYLDQLASSYLSYGNEGIDQSVVATDTEQRRDQQGYEEVSAGMIIDTVEQMFKADAQSQGIELRTRKTQHKLHIPPLVIVRILSNFISNAVAHSGATKILLAARVRSASICFEVHDNGEGMDATTLVDAQKIRSKGTDSSGSGLGLAITQSLAEEHNLVFNLRSKKGSGTCASVTIDLS